jgi:hypothetical protein
MHDVKGTIRGELKDSRWHIRYSIATGGSRLSTIWVNDLWHHEATHVLQARAIPQ